MFSFIYALGGLLVMMGRHSRAESLFYYFRLEDQVPENHLLRLTATSASSSYTKSCATPTAKPAGLRLIRRCCCAFC